MQAKICYAVHAGWLSWFPILGRGSCFLALSSSVVAASVIQLHSSQQRLLIFCYAAETASSYKNVLKLTSTSLFSLFFLFTLHSLSSLPHPSRLSLPPPVESWKKMVNFTIDQIRALVSQPSFLTLLNHCRVFTHSFHCSGFFICSLKIFLLTGWAYLYSCYCHDSCIRACVCACSSLSVGRLVYLHFCFVYESIWEEFFSVDLFWFAQSDFFGLGGALLLVGSGLTLEKKREEIKTKPSPLHQSTSLPSTHTATTNTRHSFTPRAQQQCIHQGIFFFFFERRKPLFFCFLFGSSADHIQGWTIGGVNWRP